ncbi:beta-lactamase family protein [Altererythrobacter sp. BO-6]|uniref:serine hydrolase domain-containing protein n=1 Tax=Altererythrobacter sp. BO-6 TaxID=2604537 RepID=UPI0013E0FD20|nr:serine hydrolase domain-containing protein [Altererythrobacter sp. BO-6]QIG52807.1 beta-lactamase family protein [Altererythrobacter sp. BO-6]
MRLGLSSAAMALALSGCAASYAGPVETGATQVAAVTMVTPPERDPSELEVLFWTDAQRADRFRKMEQWFAGHEVAAAPEPRALPDGAPLSPELAADVHAFMEATNAVGVMVLQDGRKRYESYRLGFGPDQRWTSFSVAKSFTATLLGAAVKDGFIKSLDDPVTRYVPALAGSAYDGVTVEQIATMTSGVAWNEDYTDPKSDVAQMNRFVVEYGPDAMVTQLRGLKREAPAGQKWVYKTGETNLIGLVVENAVGLPLAEYAKAKIVDPAGFEGELFWMTDPRGGNIGGCCLSIRLADYARMGQFALEGGNGTVPDGWFARAGDSLVDFGDSGFGYGYQWWTYPGGNYGAQGIFGQAITLLPEKQIVLAVVSNWPTATSPDNRALSRELAAKIAAAD